MTDHRDWTGKVGSIWAQEWRRTDRSFRELTPILRSRIKQREFSSLLDIGCGAGELAVGVARDNPGVPVTGVDISPELLGVASERGGDLSNLTFVLADAAQVTLDGSAKPDCLISRHGVMFFSDPETAFAHLRRQARGSASLVFSCFREREENDWVEATLSALPSPPAAPDPGEPGPFAFGDRARVESILAGAGWKDIGFEAIDYPMIFGEGDDPVADACDYLSRVGPTATPIAALEGREREATLDRLWQILAGFVVEDGVALPAAAWIVTGRAPD